MAIVITVSRVDDPRIKQRFELDKKLIFGHSVYCDVKLDDRSVAKMQCEIQTAKTGHVIVKNLDMKKEILLNQTRLKQAALKANDVLIIGPFVLAIDREKLTAEEMDLINTEYEEYC